ncbi:C-type lectin domain family 4 member M, partial [Hyalella azteca]|uniref:C-type lectin domain family 4 member M n=1 Tax=Hyalella azteca TaxID=294128 RepID=A0A979FNA3_HYAAZ
MGAPYWAANTVSVEREPSSLSPSNVEENCALISPHRGWSVHDYPCEEAGVYPVCSRIPIRGLCAHPFVLVGTQCVHVIQAEHHWGAARTQCGHIGGDLIILNDCDQYRKVNLYLTKQGYRPIGFWIGGSDVAVQGQWRWIDGSPMSMGLPYWGNSGEGEPEPDEPGVENCLELSSVWMYRFSNTM